MPRTQCNPPKLPFDQRLAREALRIQEQVKSMPPGRNRELLVRRARELKTALRVNEWLSSPGLKTPD
jgi:hypothetical protein